MFYLGIKGLTFKCPTFFIRWISATEKESLPTGLYIHCSSEQVHLTFKLATF